MKKYKSVIYEKVENESVICDSGVFCFMTGTSEKSEISLKL